MQQYLEKWKFIRLYQSFQGLKFVCRAHKQWINEVRMQLQSKKTLAIFKS